ncbi:hypothetical protein CGH64_25520 [Vibrio parahaemolyticus]|nr:hypothetical protein CGH64_25520 [Vibrio parahaemolyticus]
MVILLSDIKSPFGCNSHGQMWTNVDRWNKKNEKILIFHWFSLVATVIDTSPSPRPWYGALAAPVPHTTGAESLRSQPHNFTNKQ